MNRGKKSIEILKNYLFHDSINTLPAANPELSKDSVQSLPIAEKNKENQVKQLTFDNLRNFLLADNNEVENKSALELDISFQQIKEEDEESSETERSCKSVLCPAT
eukprot:TRINITY_DN6446_c0_g3_i5.p2 TRINITY_DN6446_c0_g3~~TRINITY_DN6446_c0_g3_i5.p2  ORF type:complete len:106 (+),score=30.87 TRINITY_DN6446_c0_g3_i5:172-489(+)